MGREAESIDQTAHRLKESGRRREREYNHSNTDECDDEKIGSNCTFRKFEAGLAKVWTICSKVAVAISESSNTDTCENVWSEMCVESMESFSQIETHLLYLLAKACFFSFSYLGGILSYVRSVLEML